MVDMVALREYVGGTVPASGEAILSDALVHGIQGALDIITLTVGVRVNRRSRHSLDDVRT